MITSEVIGMREAQRVLKQMPDRAKAAAQTVIDKTAAHIAADVKARAPRRTGRLADSIGWRSRPRSVSAAVVMDKDRMHIARFLEYGTVTMTARPFLRPAVEAARTDHLTELEAALAKAGNELAAEAKQI